MHGQLFRWPLGEVQWGQPPTFYPSSSVFFEFSALPLSEVPVTSSQPRPENIGNNGKVQKITSFTLCAVLSSMMNSHAGPVPPTRDESHPSLQHVLTVYAPTHWSLSGHLGYRSYCPGIACVQVILILLNSTAST